MESNHWQSISHNYFQAKYFCEYKEIENLYLCQQSMLSQINYHFITEVCKILRISTQISWSMNYKLIEGKTELVDLCKQAGATGTYQDQRQDVYQ